jgi:shikimate dehydrogenase
MTQVFEWKDAPEAEFAVIGDPVSHSLSPRMHAAAFSALGLPYRYVAVRVPSREVVPALQCLASLGYRGINVTVPLKEAVMGWLASVDDFAREARAVNTIRVSNRSGINTDGDGFLDTVAELGLRPPGRVVLLGAGGSARGVALALKRQGFELAVFNRTRENAEKMLSQLGVEAELLKAPDPAGAALVVNTTSAHFASAKLNVDWSSANPDAVAYDLMYGDSSCDFLDGARARGLRTVDGLGLLVAQGARSLEWWLGVTPSREAMRRAIE